MNDEKILSALEKLNTNLVALLAEFRYYKDEEKKRYEVNKHHLDLQLQSIEHNICDIYVWLLKTLPTIIKSQ